MNDLDTCGCCDTGLTKPAIFNRPGLPALLYRLGTHESFLRRMLAALGSQKYLPLKALTTRNSDDPSIALLDAWATVADVLTFYQERIANEGYLRTATERRSVLELARAIGYELKPGVAASTDLAFIIEDAAGAPGAATIPKGTKVQSIPAPGKLPQTFETVERIEARATWNKLRPQLTQPQVLTASATRLYFTGTNLNLKPGDLLLLAATAQNPAAKRILRVQVEADLQRTVVDIGDPSPLPPPPPPPVFLFELAVLDAIPFNAFNIRSSIVNRTWRERDLGAMISIQRWQPAEVVTAAPPPLPAATTGVFAFRLRAGIFGNNAPHHSNLPVATRPANDWDGTNGWEIWKDPTTAAPGTNYTEADLYLERSEPGILPATWTVLEQPTDIFTVFRVAAANQASLAGFSLSGKATGLRLANPGDNNPITKSAGFKVRKTTVHAQSEALTLAMLPIEAPVGKVSNLTLDTMVLGLQAGQRVAIGGELADTPGVIRQEIVVLTEIVHSGGYTTLFFKNPLQNSYVRKTVVLNANVAGSTNGETVAREVLGSGDGSQPNQRFVLKKPPLTYVSAQTPSGAQSTLAVRVNEVLWKEAPSLYGLEPRDENYVLHIDDDAKTTVIFGDGASGARLPSGAENVTASYRSGIGLDGQVGAGSLSLLQNPPLGLRSVSNPIAAAGAEDPEKLDQARSNAPGTVLTLDRIVSLQDYEDFARTFSGIAKARAAALWRREARRVHITVSAANGNPVPADLLTNLLKAIAAASDTITPVDVQAYTPQFFSVSAKIVMDERYIAAKVIDAVEAALKAAFAFEQRDFGQGVSAAEVISIMQAVPGVVASDLTQLYLASETAGLSQFLRTASATWPLNANIQPAQLLLINPAGIGITEMKP